jgi:hypothetical protein
MHMAHLPPGRSRPTSCCMPCHAAHPWLHATGLPAEDSWVLHGPENDRTLGMRNALAYAMGRAMGRYASRVVYAELFLVTASSVGACIQSQLSNAVVRSECTA